MAFAAAMAGLAASPLVLAGQQQPADRVPENQRCRMVIQGDREGTRIEVAPGIVNYFVGGNVRVRCANLPITIRSDSLASYQGTVVQFIGNVRYRDTTVEMDAQFGTYFRNGEKWEARTNVALRNLQDGATLRGPSLDYYRAVRGVRDTAEMYADQRPTITVPVRDSAGLPAEEPYVVVGDRVRTRGSDRVWAGGRVTIDRSDLRGRADSLELDSGAGNAGALVGTASLRQTARDSFELVGQRIDLTLERRQLTFVTARDSARLTSGTLRLDGDGIGLDVNGNQVEQTLAWGRLVRPFALASNYEIRGDSLAFDTPAQVLRAIRAYGSAWMGVPPDSATGDRDWVQGDTVTAEFEARDSAGTARPLLRTLEAKGSARALYRWRQPGQPRASISYTLADYILLAMRLGDSTAVDSVYARGNIEGVHLQPTFRRDSTAVLPPVSRVPTDTLRRPPDTTRALRPRLR